MSSLPKISQAKSWPSLTARLPTFPPPSPLITAPSVNAGSPSAPQVQSATSLSPIPHLSTSPGLAFPSIVRSLPWIWPEVNSTKPTASNSRSSSILPPLKSSSPAAATPSPNSPHWRKTASLFQLFRSRLPSRPTLTSRRATSNPPTSSPNFPAPIPPSKMNSSYSPPISIISASALPSTATASTTAPWTTLL